MKSFARPNVRRAGAAIAISAAVLSATGCGYIHEQPTTIHYAASDGVHEKVADAELRNLMVITEDKKSAGRLLGTVLNSSDKDITVTVKTHAASASIKVPAHGKVQLEKKEVLLKPAGEAPGGLLKDTKISQGSKTSKTAIPVLDGTLDEYRQYLPNMADQKSSAQPPSSPSSSH